MNRNKQGRGEGLSLSKTGGGIHYSLIQAFFWMAYCGGTGFSSTYLLSVGFDNARIGVLIALSGILAALLQPVVAGAIDRSGKRLLKPVILSGILVAVGLSLLLLAVPGSLWLFCGICFAGNLSVLQLLIPLINSLSICGRERERISFGFSRAIGSLAYAGISYVLGRMIAGFGMELLSVMRILAFLALACGVAAFPVNYSQQEESAGEEAGTGGFFERYGGFPVLMAGCFLLYLCHSFLTYYNYQIVLSKGGDEQSYGAVIALAAVLELPVMFGFTKMLQRAAASRWFLLSGIGYILKAVTALLSPNMTVYYLVQLFQMFAWAMITVASVCYVKEITREEDSTRGQAYITLSYTVAMAVGSVSGGILLQLLGTETLLVLASLFAAVGTLVLRKGIRKTEEGLSSI
ncbi:MAG: MFS transporter [Lachnospiraceae bacterium]|nr:MFS transporter [Lachnospiraceae bacterium]